MDRRFLVSTLLLGSVVAASLAAQTPRPSGSAADRTVGGHVFQPSSDFPDPFIASRVNSFIGFGGVTNFRAPVYNAEDSLVRTVTGDMAFAELDLGYQQRAAKWLAFRVGVSGAVRAGTERPTLLSEGISSFYGFGLGATARIWQTDKLLLSGALELQTAGFNGVTPLEYVQGVARTISGVLDSLQALGGITLDSAVIDSVINSIDLTGYTLYQSSQIRSSVLGARMAYAPVPWLGLTGVLQGGVGGVFNGPKSKGRFDAGIAADVDFRELWRVPLGLMLSGRWLSVPPRGSDIGTNVLQFGVGLAYTGRSDFSVGLNALFANVQERNTGASVPGQRVGLAMHYFF